MAEDLRVRILSAIERSQGAHSGRIRIETNRRDGDSPEVIAEMDAIDFTFDDEAGVLELRQEGHWPLKKWDMVNERRLFANRSLVYTRKIEIGSRFLEPEEVANGIPAQFDDSLSPVSELWVRHTFEQENLNFADMLDTNPNRPFYQGLRAVLENKEVPIRIVSQSQGETVLELWAESILLGGALSGGASGQVVLPIQVSLMGEDLSTISVDLPLADKYASYRHITTRQWRMGKPVSVSEPGISECRPERTPVRTQIKEIRLDSVDRVIGFSRGGKTWLIRANWSHGDDDPYRELRVGDQIRLWGETEPIEAVRYLPDIDLSVAPNAAVFPIWGAEYPDGADLYGTRPPDDISDVPESGDERLEDRYRNLDVRGELVTLTFAAILEEHILAYFADDVGQSCDDITLGTAAQFDAQNCIPIDRATIETCHIVEGTPVVVYLIETGRDAEIWKVELRCALRSHAPLATDHRLNDPGSVRIIYVPSNPSISRAYYRLRRRRRWPAKNR